MKEGTAGPVQARSVGRAPGAPRTRASGSVCSRTIRLAGPLTAGLLVAHATLVGTAAGGGSEATLSVEAGRALVEATPKPTHVRQAPDTLASTLDRIAHLLAPGGDRAEGMEALARHAAALPPARATLWIQVLAAVERTEAEVAPQLVEAVRDAEAGDGAGAARVLEQAAGDAAGDQRAPLLWIAALVAEGPAPGEAARIRARLLEEHPGAFEAPEAAVRQARWAASQGDPERARALLENLVVSRPDHPVVPEARRLLDRWRQP